ncbi:MAG: molecular chaperone TorD family protein [Defluviitaleaceae bacterium]|nr:molecular chaperone TorD family protein [Defluviitaleaceae bacterium]
MAMQDAQMRVQAYLSLSQLLQRPNEELLEHINNPEFDKLWQRVAGAYGIKIPKSWQAVNIPDLVEWGRAWDVTMGPVAPLAEPIESLYKIWTTDESCGISIAKEKGYLKGDWACHMEELLIKSGFQIPMQFNHCPDHLVLELEYFSLLIEDASRQAQANFAKYHLDWLEELLKTAKDRDVPKIYQDLYRLCADFVKADTKMLI